MAPLVNGGAGITIEAGNGQKRHAPFAAMETLDFGWFHFIFDHPIEYTSVHATITDGAGRAVETVPECVYYFELE